MSNRSRLAALENSGSPPPARMLAQGCSRRLESVVSRRSNSQWLFRLSWKFLPRENSECEGRQNIVRGRPARWITDPSLPVWKQWRPEMRSGLLRRGIGGRARGLLLHARVATPAGQLGPRGRAFPGRCWSPSGSRRSSSEPRILVAAQPEQPRLQHPARSALAGPSQRRRSSGSLAARCRPTSISRGGSPPLSSH